jgi:uncharacterized protein YecE (DUF72 family)
MFILQNAGLEKPKSRVGVSLRTERWNAMTFIGTAAWSLSKPSADRFPAAGSALARYAAVFDGVEINSSFYKRHRPGTWQRWADSVPDRFRFAVKVPKRVTHELRLVDAEPVFDEFLEDIAPLGRKLGPVLMQLPPQLAFDAPAAAKFFEHVRSVFDGRIVIEPRHQSWADPETPALLSRFRISRVTADPAAIAREELDTEGFLYLRLHGSPKIYYSKYEPAEVRHYAGMLSAATPDSWCVFDNTASGAALVNALEMLDVVTP